MTVVTIPSIILPRIQPQSYARNGQPAAGVAMTALANGFNQGARWRGKEQFVSDGDIANIPASAGVGPTVRWRSYLKTGPFTDVLRWIMCLRRPSAIDLLDSRANIRLQDTSGVDIDVGTAYFGPAGTVTDAVQHWGEFAGVFEVDPSTNYTLTFDVEDNGRLANALVWDECFKPDTSNGYAPVDYSSASPILRSSRAAIQTGLVGLYRDGGAYGCRFSGSRTYASSTDKNLIDDTSTAVSASTPGLTLDMRYKARLKDASTGVTCRFRAWGSVASGAGGTVELKNSAGTVLATITFTTTPGWRSTTVTLPATLAKYDIHYSTAVGALSVSEVVLYEEG